MKINKKWNFTCLKYIEMDSSTVDEIFENIRS